MQCVRINGTQSYLGGIISGVPQGSILVPILYNLFFNDFFHFTVLATAYNFADDITLACFGKTIQKLIGPLESECEVALNWFNENKMVVNPESLKPLLLIRESRTIQMKSSKLAPRKLKLHVK